MHDDDDKYCGGNDDNALQDDVQRQADCLSQSGVGRDLPPDDGLELVHEDDQREQELEEQASLDQCRLPEHPTRFVRIKQGRHN